MLCNPDGPIFVPFHNRGRNMNSPKHTGYQTAIEIVSSPCESALNKAKKGLSVNSYGVCVIVFWESRE